MDQSKKKDLIDLTAETDLFDIFNEPKSDPILVNQKSVSQKTPTNSNAISISAALSSRYSSTQEISLDCDDFAPKLNFKQHLTQSKPISSQDIMSIINPHNAINPISLQKPLKSDFEKIREKKPERVLPFYSLSKAKSEKKEQDALNSLIKWTKSQTSAECKIPEKRPKSNKNTTKSPIKKSKDYRAENREFLKQHNQPVFQVEEFIKNQKEIADKEEKSKSLAQNLIEKEKNEREYRERMRNQEIVMPELTPEELKRIEKLSRFKQRFNVASFYNFVLNIDVYDERLPENSSKIPITFLNDEAAFIESFEPAFFNEVKAEILSGINQNDMSDFCLCNFSVHSNKEGFGFLNARSEIGGKFNFMYRVQSEDILMIIPIHDTVKDSDFCRNFANWEQKPKCFIGVAERMKSSRCFDLLIRVNEPALEFFEGNPICRVFILDTSVTMLREFKMIRQAEFLDLNEYIFNPKKVIPQVRLQYLEDFVYSIEIFHNESQSDAISKVAHAVSGIILIQGPPGTGKTHTIQGILSTLLIKEKSPETCHILVCAPSNSAIDEIANRVATNKLHDLNGQPRNDVKLLRIGNNVNRAARDSRDKIKKDSRETPIKVQEISLSYLVSQYLTQSDSEDGMQRINDLMKSLEKFDKALQKARDNKKEHVIVELEQKRSGFQQQLFIAKRQNLSFKERKKEAESKFLNSANIIFSTLSAAGSKEMMSINHSFDYIIIDEACQSVELSSLIPFQFGAKLAILVGDPMQLPATTFSFTSSKNNYSRSLFERLMLGSSKVEMLTIQYRMIPEICEFPSMYFYNNRLETFEAVKNFQVPTWIRNSGILLINLRTSQESRSQSETSLSNTSEAEFIGKLYTFLKPLHGSKLGIGIITPYKKQVIIIKEYLNRFYENDWRIDIEVNTIDGFQGREKDVIIFSTVRSGDTIGFLADTRRMNVAITRAKFGLWVIGKMECLEKNRDWGEFVLHCKNYGKVVNCNGFDEISEKFTPSGESQEFTPARIYHKRRKQKKVIEKKRYPDAKVIVPVKKNNNPSLALDIINRK